MWLVGAGGNIWTRRKQEWINQVCKWDSMEVGAYLGSVGNFRQAIHGTWHHIVCVRWRDMCRNNPFWASPVKSTKTVSPSFSKGRNRLQLIGWHQICDRIALGYVNYWTGINSAQIPLRCAAVTIVSLDCTHYVIGAIMIRLKKCKKFVLQYINKWWVSITSKLYSTEHDAMRSTFPAFNSLWSEFKNW